MLIYKFLKNLAALSMLVLYRKIYFIDADKLPNKHDGATIFAVNHPTAFTDSFIFMVYSPFDCYFILRGDFFKVSKFVRWFMDQIRLVPIFRQRDGFSALKENQTLFDQFYEILNEGKDISIMVEGSHDYRKRLRTVQRGTARIVFGTYEKYQNSNIQIVPIGLTYSDVTKFRSTAAVRFGDPIYLKDYLALHQENERKAMISMTKEIGERMKPLLVHVEKEEDDKLVDHLLDMNRHNQKRDLFPSFSKNPSVLEAEIAISNKVNALEENEKAGLKERVNAYFEQLKVLNISDLGIAKAKQIGFGTTLFLVFFSPFFLVGYLLGFVPLQVAKFVKNKMKKPEFIGSMMLVGGMFGYLIYFILILVVAAIIGRWWAWTTLLLMPFVSYFSILYRDVFLEWWAAGQFNRLEKETQIDLVKQREMILGLDK